MNKRKPTDPIPGFEDEYTGTVGHERAVHRTHFHSPGIKFRDTGFDSGYEWIRRGGKWLRVKKEDHVIQ